MDANELKRWLSAEQMADYEACKKVFDKVPIKSLKESAKVRIDTYESLAACRRVIWEANNAHDDNWIDSWFTANKSKISARIAGFPRDSKEEIEVRRQREFDKAEKEYLDPKPEDDHD
jgi:O-acetyl-ADP-ribose deacetylase (regulator of RNase III)